MTEEKILDNCREIGTYFKEKLLWLKGRHSVIDKVRGLGLLLAMVLKMDGETIVTECLKKGFLINCIQGNVLRFAPPLIVSQEQVDALIDCLDDILTKIG